MLLDNGTKILKIAILGVLLLFEIYAIWDYYFKEDPYKTAANGHYIVAIDETITVDMAERIMKRETQ